VFLILGCLSPLVIGAQPYGTTQVDVFDTEFLAAPGSPLPGFPGEPAMPDWQDLEPVPLTLGWLVPTVPDTEFGS